MQQNTPTRIFLFAALTLFAMGAAFQMFSMEGNVLGNSFRLLTPLAIVLGLATSRLPFYLLLAAGAYLDLIKRFMILDYSDSPRHWWREWF
jgi:predicted membrane channel-forming protein YqfA (hemolysin III family)